MRHLQEVDVTLRDSSIDPEEIHVKAHEPVRFIVRNEGQVDHEFRVVGVPGSVDVGNVEPGRAKTLEHTFHETGVFEAACYLPGHESPDITSRLVVE